MLQIAIWGIALMLVVKGFDVLHQKSIAAAMGHAGNPKLANIAAIVAFVGALILFLLASAQASPTPTPPSFGNY